MKDLSGNNEISSIRLFVNGTLYVLTVGKEYKAVSHEHTLAYTLRETLGYTGTKIGCDQGACGSCTVLVNGNPILSCTTLTIECDNFSIETIEGLENKYDGKLHSLQQAFIDNTAFQCGFCTPGIIMNAKSLLEKNPNPSENDIKNSLSGHYCRCISHYEVIQAILDAARMSKDNG